MNYDGSILWNTSKTGEVGLEVFLLLRYDYGWKQEYLFLYASI